MLSRKTKTKTQAALTSTSTSIGFLSLPPEIRNEVYTLCLRNRKPIKVRYNKPPYGWAATHWSEAFSPNLLATCQAVYAEAAPVLYGSNTFSFGYGESMRPMDYKRFFVHGPRAPHSHVRHVKLHHVRAGQRRHLFAELGKCSNLQSLEIYTATLGYKTAPSFIAKQLMPMVKAWQESSKSTTDVADILKPLQILDGSATPSLVLAKLSIFLRQP
jgi:hypothetical protein